MVGMGGQAAALSSAQLARCFADDRNATDAAEDNPSEPFEAHRGILRAITHAYPWPDSGEAVQTHKR